MTTIFLKNNFPFLQRLLASAGVELPGIKILVLEGRNRIVSFEDHILGRLISVVPEEKKAFLIKTKELLSLSRKKQKITIPPESIEEVAVVFE